MGLELPGSEERQVGSHRLGRPPVGGGLAVAHLAADHPAVGDHLAVAGHGDVDVEGGLVERVVVGREPPRRHVRLVHGDDLVAVGQPVALAGVGDRAGLAAVAHDHREHRARSERRDRRDLQLVRAGLREPRPDTVDLDLVDGQEQVEVEAAQRLGRLDPQPGPARQPTLAEGVAVMDVVVQDVDAAVAVHREVGIADPRGADDRIRHTLGVRRGHRGGQDCDEGDGTESLGPAHEKGRHPSNVVEPVAPMKPPLWDVCAITLLVLSC